MVIKDKKTAAKLTEKDLKIVKSNSSFTIPYLTITERAFASLKIGLKLKKDKNCEK